MQVHIRLKYPSLGNHFSNEQQLQVLGLVQVFEISTNSNNSFPDWLYIHQQVKLINQPSVLIQVDISYKYPSLGNHFSGE